MTPPALSVGFLLFEGLLQLDLTGPLGVMSRVPGIRIDLLARNPEPVTSSDGLVFQPTGTLGDFSGADALIVPGGSGILPLLEDAPTLSFLRACSRSCRIVASVCTGALVLGAAGLLQNREATTHWQSADLLPLLGARPVARRVVFDGPIATSAGVTSGIDLALALVGRLGGDRLAQTIQLELEYAPEPPYTSGDPATAPDEIRTHLETEGLPRHTARKRAVLNAARRLEKNEELSSRT